MVLAAAGAKSCFGSLQFEEDALNLEGVFPECIPVMLIGAPALRMMLRLQILPHHLFTKLHALGRCVYISTAAEMT